MAIPKSELEYRTEPDINLKYVNDLLLRLLILFRKYYPHDQYGEKILFDIVPTYHGDANNFEISIRTESEEFARKFYKRLLPKIDIPQHFTCSNWFIIGINFEVRGYQLPYWNDTSHLRRRILENIIPLISHAEVSRVACYLPRFIDSAAFINENYSANFKVKEFEWLSFNYKYIIAGAIGPYLGAISMHVYVDELEKYMKELLKNKG